jgi:hypothetical protein
MVDLGLEIGNMDEHLDAFKIEEIARAKIAEANYNSFLEKQNKKTAPQTEEAKKDFTMEVILGVNSDNLGWKIQFMKNFHGCFGKEQDY